MQIPSDEISKYFKKFYLKNRREIAQDVFILPINEQNRLNDFFLSYNKKIINKWKISITK